mgnify:CR=1 FL=1
MQQYYDELAHLVYVRFGISPYQKIFYGEYYLTVQDYLIAASFSDPIKNLYTLLSRFSSREEMMNYLTETVRWIIQETLSGNEAFRNYYYCRLKTGLPD